MAGMQSDYYYAEMLRLMREQGKKDNPTTLQIGIMQSDDKIKEEIKVKVDDLILEAEDLYIADYLLSDYTRKLEVPYLAEDSSIQTKVTYSEGLKEGDLVVLQKLSNNMYVILAKVVRLK